MRTNAQSPHRKLRTAERRAGMKNDFSTGKVSSRIISQAAPLMLAQLVHLLYNVVDRVYIGHMAAGEMALTGIGLAFPLTSLTGAFINLFSTGGAPLFAIARGANDEERASRLQTQVMFLLLSAGIVITALEFAFLKPILYLFGAGPESYPFAREYAQIYIWGTVFSMLATGLNSFINAQGYPVMGMMTITLGAVLNLVLDPLFIFVFDMGIRGAAIATVLSQIASAVWVMAFLFGKKNLYPIRRQYFRPDFSLIREILPLGFAGFIMQGTNSLNQAVCNNMLGIYGGDLYVGIMTVIDSVREIMQLPNSSITSGSQPVIGYNLGARKYSRVRAGIRFMTLATFLYTATAWAAVLLFPRFFMGIFTDSTEMIGPGVAALRLYFAGFVFMTFQSAGQSTFTGLKCPKRAIFFSLFRKVVIVVPLTILLPRLGLGVRGVFLAEPISNLIGGLACYSTMWFTLYRKLPKQDDCPAKI